MRAFLYSLFNAGSFFLFTFSPYPTSRVHPHVVGMLRFMLLTINQPSLPTPFYSVLVSVSVFMVFSAVFHFINSPDNSPLSHSVLLVLFLPHWSFQLCLFMKVFFSPHVILCGSLSSHHHLSLNPRVVGAPQMISQPLSSIFSCSPLPSGTW